MFLRLHSADSGGMISSTQKSTFYTKDNRNSIMSEEVSEVSEYVTPPSSPGTLKNPEFIEFRKSMEQSSNEFEVVRQGELKKHIMQRHVQN